MTASAAAALAQALGGRKAGTAWMARCPAHEDHEPSLSISNATGDKVLVHCHAGCDQVRVIAALRGRGLWADNGPRLPSRTARRTAAECKQDQDDAKRSKVALVIWQSSKPAQGTPVETYLASRGIYLPPPDTLRFHVGLKHPSGRIWPAMVALLTNGADGSPLAIHRTYLARNGGGKAPIEPQKMMLGPCRGGAVRLGPPSDELMVGEGIETCLAAMQATGLSAWAALSTSGLKALDLPHTVRAVTVLADGDDPGEAAARDCARRWTHEGRQVRIARAPSGLDFNDLLLRGAGEPERAA